MQKSVSCDDYLEVVVCVRGEACWPDIFLVDPSFVDSKNEIDSLEMFLFDRFRRVGMIESPEETT
jgi:hypothetical protein